MAALSRQHRLATRNAVTVQRSRWRKVYSPDELRVRRLRRFRISGAKRSMHALYRSDRDDWTLAMVAAGLGWAFMPVHAVGHPGIVGLPIIEPEFWREVNLVTVRGRPHSPAVGALAREAMSTRWFGRRALGSREPGMSMMLSGSRSRCDRRQSNCQRPVPLTHDAVITTPGRASCRMKPSTGSNSPVQGAASRTLVASR